MWGAACTWVILTGSTQGHELMMVVKMDQPKAAKMSLFSVLFTAVMTLCAAREVDPGAYMHP